MSLIESTCPNCREKVTVDDSRETLFCMYCGASFSVGDLTEFHGRMVLQKDKVDEVASPEIDPRAITVRGAENVNAPVRLFIDGKAVADVKKEQVLVLDVNPGLHTVWARVGIEGSRKSEIDLHEGDRLQIIYKGLRGYEVVRQ